MPMSTTTVDQDLPTVVRDTPDLPHDPASSPDAELDRQVEAYLQLGLHTLAGLSPAGLREVVEPLRAVLPGTRRWGRAPGEERGDHVPFVVVLGGIRDLNDAVPAMRRRALRGVSVIDREELATYLPLEDVRVPDDVAYLLTGIDTGSDLCGVTPENALAAVRAAGRTPLTVAEGLALVTLRPDMLRPNRCFSLLGSRSSTQRVPAIWISERRPKLGWCWDRNPHTWLGAASATARVSAGSDGPAGG